MKHVTVCINHNGKITHKRYEVVNPYRLTKKERITIAADNPHGVITLANRKTTTIYPEWNLINNQTQFNSIV